MFLALLIPLVGLLLLIVGGSLLLTYLLTLGVPLLLVALGVKWAASSISQVREYMADACAAQWTRNPRALAEALTKIRDGVSLERAKAVAVSPLLIHAAAAGYKEPWAWRLYAFLFHSHPKVEDRIERLRSIAPLGGADWQLGTPRKGFLAALERLLVPLISLAATVVAVALVVAYVSLASSVRTRRSETPTPGMVQPSPPITFGTVNETTVRLREGPGTNTRILTLLPKGTRVRILQSKGDWYAVEVEGTGKRGWVAKRLITLEDL